MRYKYYIAYGKLGSNPWLFETSEQHIQKVYAHFVSKGYESVLPFRVEEVYKFKRGTIFNSSVPWEFVHERVVEF